MNNMRNKILMTLALLLTAVMGAWAEEGTLLTTITATDKDSYSETTPGVVTVTLSNVAGYSSTYGWLWGEKSGPGSVTVEAKEGYTITRCVFKQSDKTPVTITTSPFAITFADGECVQNDDMDGVTSIEVYGPAAPAEPAIDVKWDAANKTGNFTMPAFDVEIAPIYAPVAQWAKVENVDQLPTAAEGIYAESTDAIVTAGTVAKIGETENVQGTLMYAVGTSATEQPALTAFSATLPTATNITNGGDVYVWYYIKGADAPQGQDPTAENTFNDSEICTTPLKVTVLNNKFNIQFTAANANTIEAGKATVTVGGTAATVTEGKLEGVKMGSEVKVTAKEGYKFRKVEVKKKASIAEGHALTSAKFGEIVGSDGKAYAAADKDILPSGVTAAALVCYVDGNGHGLALALTDEVDKMNWSTAQTTCDAHTPAITGGKWMLASKGEWDNMISAAGSHTALRDGFSSVGGTNMQSEGYWSSTEDDSSDAWNYYFSNGLWSDVSKNWKRCVRACLAF